MNEKRPKFTYFFIALIYLAAIFDMTTFLMSNAKAFEANPLSFFTGHFVYIIIGLKLLISIFLTYVILKSTQGDFGKFFITSLALYVIVLQCVGGAANLLVTHKLNTQPEGTIIPLTPDAAMKEYGTLQLTFYAYPMLMGLLSFKFWQWLWPRKKEEDIKTPSLYVEEIMKKSYEKIKSPTNTSDPFEHKIFNR